MFVGCFDETCRINCAKYIGVIIFIRSKGTKDKRIFSFVSCTKKRKKEKKKKRGGRKRKKILDEEYTVDICKGHWSLSDHTCESSRRSWHGSCDF